MSTKNEYTDMNFNVNELFTFTYNVDALKTMMQFLYNNQKTLIAKVSMIEEKQNDQQAYISAIDMRTYAINSNNRRNDNKNDPNDNNTLSKDIDKDNTDRLNSDNYRRTMDNVSLNKHHHLSKSTIKISSQDIQLQQIQQQLFLDKSKIDNKIKGLESQISSLQKNIQSIEKHPLLNKGDQEELNPIQVLNDLEVLKEKDTEIETKLVSIDSILDELKVKVCDFNIYEIFKDTKIEKGEVNISEALIQNLEIKTFKKFQLIDERMKQSDFELIKSKKDFTNMKSQLDSAIYTNNTQMSNLSNLHKQLNSNQIDTATTVNQLQKQHESLTDQLLDIKDSHLRESMLLKQMNDNCNNAIDSLNTKVNIQNANKDKETYVTDQQLIKLKESITKKLYELDTKINEMNPIEKLRNLDKSITTITESLDLKGGKDDISNMNEKIIHILTQLDYLNDTDSNITSSLDKIIKDINSHQNKLDLFQAWLETLKIDNSNNSKILKKDFTPDLNRKYLEMNTFNDYMKLVTKDKDKLHKEIEDAYHLISSLTTDLNIKANEIDLKRIEDYLINSIEELKKNIGVKYVEKIEMTKRYRLIEQQIRYVRDSQMKKNDIGEKWLLAKKPVGGHNCASCDSYIGDLNQSNEYIAWNKIPVKEPIDAIGYRV